MEFPKIKTPEEIKEIEEKRARVSALRKMDNKYEDSIKKLAEHEGDYRSELKKRLEKRGHQELLEDAGFVNEEADIYSDETLEKMEAEKKVGIDGLTGLKRRSAFLGEASKIINIEIRSGADFSVLMLDADFFKKINDDFGHPAGDSFLVQIAEIIKRNVRKADLVCRYGGEEFVILLPDTEKDGALTVAEKIKESMENNIFKIENNEGDEVELKGKTLSIGCVVSSQMKEYQDFKKRQKEGRKDPDHFNSQDFLEKMIRCADEALYRSKNSGRNKVTLYEKIKVEVL
ncbi:MAG TPA: GGDEF domain-containing protein [Candidatus Moranbacteria bacterium]|nr:GGDEF domain-containing protein [Candidatus Moranbacteria bacterium]